MAFSALQSHCFAYDNDNIVVGLWLAHTYGGQIEIDFEVRFTFAFIIVYFPHLSQSMWQWKRKTDEKYPFKFTFKFRFPLPSLPDNISSGFEIDNTFAITWTVLNWISVETNQYFIWFHNDFSFRFVAVVRFNCCIFEFWWNCSFIRLGSFLVFHFLVCVICPWHVLVLLRFVHHLLL